MSTRRPSRCGRSWPSACRPASRVSPPSPACWCCAWRWACRPAGPAPAPTARLAPSCRSRCLDPVLDGGGGDEDAVVAPEVPTGGLVGEAIFGDQTDRPLLDAAGVLAVRQSQVGEITG